MSPGLTCSHFGFPFNHYIPYLGNCRLLYRSPAGAWDSKVISTNNDDCEPVEELYCS